MTEEVDESKALKRGEELSRQEAEAVKDKAADLDAIHEIDFGRDTKWTKDIKIQTVATYMIVANIKKTAKIMNISLPTIKHWKYNTEWWEECMSVLRKVKNEELDIKLTHIIDKGLAELSDRLQYGDEVVSSGKKMTKKVSASDIARIIGIAHDKRSIGRNSPSRTSDAKTNDAIQELAQQFKQIADQNRREGVEEGKQEKEVNAIDPEE